jgi:hypothetical protein
VDFGKEKNVAQPATKSAPTATQSIAAQVIFFIIELLNKHSRSFRGTMYSITDEMAHDSVSRGVTPDTSPDPSTQYRYFFILELTNSTMLGSRSAVQILTRSRSSDLSTLMYPEARPLTSPLVVFSAGMTTNFR